MSKGFIIITGASSGIGKATAEALSSKGYSLLLIGRRVQQMENMKLPNALCKNADVTDLKGFQKAVEEGEKTFGAPLCLVNNAGVMLLGDVAAQDPKEWKKMVDVNVVGVLNGIHLVLKKMVERKKGTIINVSSVAGRKTFPHHAAYCGTKFAVHALSENIRQEVAKHGVRVITIAPGAVETELLSHTSSDQIKKDYEAWKVEMGGVLRSEDIARAILYAFEQPPNVCVREVVIAATRQEP